MNITTTITTNIGSSLGQMEEHIEQSNDDISADGNDDHYRSPTQYSFGFEHSVDEHGARLHRSEVLDESGTVRGAYGYVDVATGLTRQVHYIADHLGFRVSVLSNEPGIMDTSNHQPASVRYRHPK